MTTPIDCLLVGYHDQPFAAKHADALSRAPDDPERRILAREHLRLGDERLNYMDVLARAAHPGAEPDPERPLLHHGEVPNLAAAYLQSYLVSRGHRAERVSLWGAERGRAQALLDASPAPVVAITTTYYIMPWPVIEVVSDLRALAPHATIVVGGPLVTNLVADLASDDLQEILQLIDADVYIHESQGEATLERLVALRRQGRGTSMLANAYVRGSDGRFAFTYAATEDNALDECAIDWDAVLVGPNATVHTRTARSCAFKCAFCDYPTRAGALSLTSLERVEWELQALERQGVEHVVFVDDTFNVPPKRFNELCRMMIRNDFSFAWYSFFRATSTRDAETFDLMRASNCGAVFLGIESGDDRILGNMAKKASTDLYRRGIEALKARGIGTFASFIAGYPGETDESVANTIRFIDETGPDYFRCEPFWYNHRSPVKQLAEGFGLTGRAYDWRHDTMDIHGACDATDHIFESVTASRWMPGQSFDFWALPYLYGKGFTPGEITAFHDVATRVMRANDAPGAHDPAATAAAWHELSAAFADRPHELSRFRTAAAAPTPAPASRR
jgi:p-methyltransferase